MALYDESRKSGRNRLLNPQMVGRLRDVDAGIASTFPGLPAGPQAGAFQGGGSARLGSGLPDPTAPPEPLTPYGAGITTGQQTALAAPMVPAPGRSYGGGRTALEADQQPAAAPAPAPTGAAPAGQQQGQAAAPSKKEAKIETKDGDTTVTVKSGSVEAALQAMGPPTPDIRTPEQERLYRRQQWADRMVEQRQKRQDELSAEYQAERARRRERIVAGEPAVPPSGLPEVAKAPPVPEEQKQYGENLMPGYGESVQTDVGRYLADRAADYRQYGEQYGLSGPQAQEAGRIRGRNVQQYGEQFLTEPGSPEWLKTREGRLALQQAKQDEYVRQGTGM